MTSVPLAGASGRPKWHLGSNGTLTPSRAAADAALIAKFGGVVLRSSQEQGWGSVASRCGPFATACSNVGISFFQTCQPLNHVVPKTQAGLDAWGEFVAECTTQAHRVSGGNEVNGFGSKETPNPSGQADMFLSAIEATTKLNPGARLATPSLCPASGKLGSSYVEPLLFFDTMIAAQPSILDYPHLEIDWHGYGPFGQLVDAPESLKTWNTAYRTLELDNDLARMGHANMRISWSEFGEPVGNGGKDAAFQAQQFDHYLALLSSPAFAHVQMRELIWYTLRDDGSSGWPGTSGLVDIHGNEKPIVAHFTAASKLVNA